MIEIGCCQELRKCHGGRYVSLKFPEGRSCYRAQRGGKSTCCPLLVV